MVLVYKRPAISGVFSPGSNWAGVPLLSCACAGRGSSREHSCTIGTLPGARSDANPQPERLCHREP